MVHPPLRVARFLALLACGIGFVCFSPAMAGADSLRFFLEYDYTLSDTTTEEAGRKEITDARTFSQEYRLAFDRRIFPFLVFRGGGLFERADSSVDDGATEIDSTLTRTNPYLDLIFSNPIFSAGAGYNRREDRIESSGAADSTLIRELYNGSFGWHPVELPSLDIRFTRSETYDEARQQQDTVNDRLLVGSEYQPRQEVELSYQGTLNMIEDRLNQVETDETIHSGRVTYDDRLLNDRAALHANYNISRRETTITASGQGEVELPVFPFAGLSLIDPFPTPVELLPNPALINGQTGDLTGIDIGSAADGEDERQLGLDLLDPETEVNTLLVWVNQDLNNRPTITDSFAWEVYSSDDNLDWTFVATIQPAPFGPFDNRFEIRFPTQRHRYLKVVTLPLRRTVPGALDFPEIIVTELQARLIRPAAEAEGTTEQIAHLANVTGKVALLERPGLDYDFSLFYTYNDLSATSRMSLTNGLSLRHRFNPVFATTAQVAREDIDDPAEDQTAYRYSAALTATPLPALSHTLVYSGRTELLDEGTARRNSLFLNNRAALYRGVDVLLNGGVSQGKEEDGAETENYLVNFGTTVVPHRTTTINLTYSADETQRLGGDQPDADTYTRRGRFSLAYNPLPAISLFFAAEQVEREEDTRTLMNYALNWSPFRDGALQFSFTYNETLRSEGERGDVVERLIVPSARWEIRRGTFLDLTYALITSDEEVRDTETKVFSALLRASF